MASTHATESNVRFLLTCIEHTGDGKTNHQAVADVFPDTDNVRQARERLKRLRAALLPEPYKRKDGAEAADQADEGTGGGSVATPAKKKPATQRKPRQTKKKTSENGDEQPATPKAKTPRKPRQPKQKSNPGTANNKAGKVEQVKEEEVSEDAEIEDDGQSAGVDEEKPGQKRQSPEDLSPAKKLKIHDVERIETTGGDEQVEGWLGKVEEDVIEV